MLETERTGRVGRDLRNNPGPDLGPSRTPFLLRFSFMNEIHAKVLHEGWISFVQLAGSATLQFLN